MDTVEHRCRFGTGDGTGAATGVSEVVPPAAPVGTARAPLGPVPLLAFAAGVCSPWLLPTLPSAATLCACALLVALAAWRLPAAARMPLLLAFAGLLWMCLQAGTALERRLPFALEGEDLRAVGRVVDLPRRDEDAWRFQFCPERAWHRQHPLSVAGCWRLGWYAPRNAGRGSERVLDALPVIRAGERWQFTVRLKRPRGLRNPGGFDSERRALELGIVATGYVRDAEDNRRLAAATGVDALRERIADAIDAVIADTRQAALLRGLAIGDRRGFEERDWETLRRTGTGHLFAISGLHVGMVAIFVGGAVLALTWLFPRLLRLAPRRSWPLLPGLLAALGYALLAGFEVPARRTVLMLAVAALVVWSRRSVGLWQGWCMALAAVLLIDALAALNIGFWLSFLGVAWLLLAAQGRGRQPFWQSAPQTQWAVSLGLLPVTVGFFAEASWISPLVNLLAIPWVTLVVVPLLLLALPFLALWPALAALLLELAAVALAWSMSPLDALSAWPGAASPIPPPRAFAFACATLAMLLCVLPPAARLRWLALPLLLPLLLPWTRPPAEGEFRMHVLDVGQGTSVLVQTRRHALLFDTGARFPNGFDLGRAVVVPALNALGVRRLDALVVSHADNDHAGGALAVAAAFPVARLLLGEPVPDLTGGPCHEPERWRWDGVEFALLHPPPRYPAAGNEASCVLHVAGRNGSALLTGDAGEVAEMRMLNLHRERLPADVLLLGHHGSRHSSSGPFLDAVRPGLAIATAGYRNRYQHPQPQVLERLRTRGIDWLVTADTGALELRFDDRGVHVQAHRQRHRRFWHEP